MNLELQNKVIVLTGATGGIGYEIAKDFLLEDSIVVCLVRDNKKFVEIKKTLGEEGYAVHKLHSQQLDLLDFDSFPKILADIYNKFGSIDVLVNCAGHAVELPLALMEVDTIENIIDVNLKSPILLSKACLKYMFIQKHGVIINVSSIASGKKGRGIVAYASAKAGLETFSRTLAMETGRKNIRVNCVRPGAIETKMSSNLETLHGDKVRSMISLERFGKPQEISKIVLIVASDRVSSYLNGETITVDGGLE